MAAFLRDLRFAARSLKKSPGFTIVVLATLALGIGATTAIFSVVNAVLLAPLPFSEPERLVRVYQTLPAQGVFNNGASYLNFSDWAREARSLEGLAAIRLHDYTLTGEGEPALVVAGTVTSDVFRVLGARADSGARPRPVRRRAGRRPGRRSGRAPLAGEVRRGPVHRREDDPPR